MSNMYELLSSALPLDLPPSLSRATTYFPTLTSTPILPHSEFCNADETLVLHRIAIATAGYKEVYTSLENILTWCYESHYKETGAIVEADHRLLSVWKRLKKIWVEQQTLKDAYDAEMHRYVDVATLKELKVKDYQEDLTRMREELRLEQWANIGVEKSLTSLKEE
ncbi:hypothetical protein C1H46_033145 [Malus baccata]|uniref:Uncharacterized protein n=1 Tax=Malus baccata TaxID=106549 RepID=A0A540L487_MALBA|nr:hypothetical protein C1H46_033145 [Malus baccata]